MSVIIETRNLVKFYPVFRGYRDVLRHPFQRKYVPALKDISLQVRKGEVFGLLGLNGSGKTTLLKILATLVRPTKGRARVHGLDVVEDERRVKALIGVIISDERSFFWRLTGRRNLLFFATLNNIPEHEARNRIHHLVRLLGFEDKLDEKFYEYSTGTRQKMAIARGLLTDPQILIMDEPTRSLDPSIASQLHAFIKEELIQKEQKTIVLATNNMHEAADICDTIAILQNGHLRHCGGFSDILKQYQPKNRFILVIIGSMEDLQTEINQSQFLDQLKHIKLLDRSRSAIQLRMEIPLPEKNIARFIHWLVAHNFSVISCREQRIPLEELFSRSVYDAY